MPSFTLELHEVIELTKGDIGLDKYVIFNESYRSTLNNKIIQHYYNQEIGQETVSMFRLALSRRMNEIMPYYNQLYRSELLAFNPLETMNIETTGETGSSQENTASGTTTNVTDSKARSVSSDFPQVQLSGNQDYATNAADTTSNASSEAESAETSSSALDGHTTSQTRGFQGSVSDLLARYRETFLNIDQMVISELAECFMAIWNISDTYTERMF